jgi:hypothetical protein
MKAEPPWITDWSEIDDKVQYIVCAVNNGDRGFYLSRPEITQGWQVKHRMQGCYAAIPCPPLVEVK